MSLRRTVRVRGLSAWGAMLRDPSFNTRVSSLFIWASEKRHNFETKHAVQSAMPTLYDRVASLTWCCFPVLSSGAEDSDHAGVDVDEWQTPRGQRVASHWLTGWFATFFVVPRNLRLLNHLRSIPLLRAQSKTTNIIYCRIIWLWVSSYNNEQITRHFLPGTPLLQSPIGDKTAPHQRAGL